MNQLDNTSIYSSENDHQQVNNQPAYNTMNQYYLNAKCPYTTGPGQAVINPAYIVPNETNTDYQIFVPGFLPTTGNGSYYTLTSAYPFPPITYAPNPLVPMKKD